MPSHTIESPIHEDGMFPDDTALRIEWVSDEQRHRPKGKIPAWTSYKQRMLYWTGEISGQFTKHFDPGKYVWKAHKHTQDGLDTFSCKGEFLVGMTQQQWQRISHLRPKMQRARMTTDGCVFSCEFPGCAKKTTSQMAAVLHESKDHYGEDLLENPGARAVVEKRIDEAFNKVPKRGPGRPRLQPE